MQCFPQFCSDLVTLGIFNSIGLTAVTMTVFMNSETQCICLAIPVLGAGGMRVEMGGTRASLQQGTYLLT